MKRNLRIIISASAASVLASSTLAQTASTPTPDQPEAKPPGQRGAHRWANRLNGAAKASDVIGMAVKNYQDQDLGKVEDLAVDVESGRVVQVILSTGGFVGIGDKLTAVPPGALHHDVAKNVLHLDADLAKVKSSPDFEMSKWAECCDAKHLSGVYRHYGEENALGFVHPGDSRHGDRIDAVQSTDAGSSPRTEGTWDKNRASSQGLSLIPEARLAHVQKASKVFGTQVRNLQDEKLGHVDNLLLDMTSGRVVAVIVSSGGFLGLGDELSAVPPYALRFSQDRETLQLDTSKEALANAPHFKANQWPDFSQPGYAAGVYHAYRVEPYFTTNAPAGADNTVRNARDRGTGALTPLDQGNSQADVDITARIRKGILDGKDMSVNARNVKVITKDGQVTLRGPVDTANEKRVIGDIAIDVALAANVDNQLDVK